MPGVIKLTVYPGLGSTSGRICDPLGSPILFYVYSYHMFIYIV
jgi:hypothetical protein